MSTLINIDVPDVQQALTFYTTATDCPLRRIPDEETAALDAGTSDGLPRYETTKTASNPKD